MDYQNSMGGDRRPDDDGVVETGRTLGYSILYGENGLDFRRLTLADPVPVGRQILEAAGVRDAEQWAAVAILPNGAMEDIRLGETYDLRGAGVERVLAFRTDTLFRGFLQGQDMLWGRRDIRGDELLALAALGKSEALYLDVPGGTDQLIAADTIMDLSKPGVERFIAGPKPADPGSEITIGYNGLSRQVRVLPKDTIAQVIETVRPLFGNPGGDLLLVEPVSGRALEPTRTVTEEGVKPHASLQLRPRAVQGG